MLQNISVAKLEEAPGAVERGEGDADADKPVDLVFEVKYRRSAQIPVVSLLSSAESGRSGGGANAA